MEANAAAPLNLKANKMAVQPEGKLLFGMGAPLAVSMLIQAVYNIVDSIFVSYLGENALTAVSLSFPIFMLMISVAVGTGVGINSLISRRLGAKRHAEAEHAAGNGLTLMILSMLVFVLFGIFGTRPTSFRPSFWSNALITMLILLGPAIEDSANGKGVFEASAVRTALFVAVALYAWGTVWILERWRNSRQRSLISEPA